MRTLQAGAAGHDGDAGGQVRVAGRDRQRKAAAQGVAHEREVRRPQLGGDVAHKLWETRYNNQVTNKTLLKPFYSCFEHNQTRFSWPRIASLLTPATASAMPSRL